MSKQINVYGSEDIYNKLMKVHDQEKALAVKAGQKAPRSVSSTALNVLEHGLKTYDPKKNPAN